MCFSWKFDFLIVIQNNVILTLRFSSCSGTSMALLMSVCGHGVYGGLGRGASQWWTPCPSNAAQDGIGKLLLYILKHESECSKRLDVFFDTHVAPSFLHGSGGWVFSTGLCPCVKSWEFLMLRRILGGRRRYMDEFYPPAEILCLKCSRFMTNGYDLSVVLPLCPE